MKLSWENKEWDIERLQVVFTVKTVDRGCKISAD